MTVSKFTIVDLSPTNADVLKGILEVEHHATVGYSQKFTTFMARLEVELPSRCLDSALTHLQIYVDAGYLKEEQLSITKEVISSLPDA